MAKDYAYLVCVDGKKNQNKYYEMTLNDDYSIDVNYGRVGGRNVPHHYPSFEKDFYSLRLEKLYKGYEDRTALHSDINRDSAVQEELSYKPIENEDVNDVINLLITSSRDFMQTNYKVTAAEVNSKMLNEAQRDINRLRDIAYGRHTVNALYEFNDTLNQLFIDIPRKMGRVADNFATKSDDFEKIIEREELMLDNLRGLCTEHQNGKSESEGKDQTVLEANGITMRGVTYKEEDQILAHLGRDYGGNPVEDRYVKAYAVENKCTRTNYENFKKENHIRDCDVKLFYHGSKVENWYSIMKTGLSLNPNARVTGKMFGNGLYFAPDARKSLNYMDVSGSRWNNGTRHTGFCAIYAVALGKCYKPHSALSSRFSKEDLPDGTQSVYADKHLTGLRNDEYIIYDQSQCTIKYLMEMTEPNVQHKEYKLDRNLLRNRLSEGFNKLVKTSQNGVEAEFSVEKLPSECQAEINDKITQDCDYDKLYIKYNIKLDKISLEQSDVNGNRTPLFPSVTNNDLAFLSREMKKTFVESEDKWKELMTEIKEYPVGKSYSLNQEDTKETIKQIERNN